MDEERPLKLDGKGALTVTCGIGLVGASLAFKHTLAPWGLLLGIGLGLADLAPKWKPRAKFSKICLQVAVVLLGFQVSLGSVIKTGVEGLSLALTTIVGVLLLGLLGGRLLGIPRTLSWLISGGTAICGGSAIAAIATTLDADEGEVAVAAGTVFVLNAAGMLLLPVVGKSLGMQSAQFGVWAGISIHDVASVAGAAATFGGAAIATATTVKLSRVLYLIPVVLLIGVLERHKKTEWTRVVPWFVFGFLATAGLRAAIPAAQILTDPARQLSQVLFVVSLFLIGLGVSRAQLKKIGLRPLGLGTGLWLALCGAGYLAAVR